jgi:hypothetical protein
MPRALVLILVLLIAAPVARGAVLTPGGASLQFHGSAHAGAGGLVLTDDDAQVGSVWYQTPVSLAEPFRVTFSYRTESLGFPALGHGDGFAFVVQSPTGSLVPLGTASSGAGHGYGGIPNSFGLVVDTYQANELGLYRNGSTAFGGTTDWNTLDAIGNWKHGVPGFPLPAGIDPNATPPVCTTLPQPSCTVGAAVFDLFGDPGSFARISDFWIGHGGALPDAAT